LLGALETILLYTLPDNPQTMVFLSGGSVTYGFFSALLGFALVFRQNISYNRYLSARTQINTMTAAWIDAAQKILSFDLSNNPKAWDKNFNDPDAGAITFKEDIVHWFSLLHALSLQFLRFDWQIKNLKPHGTHNLPAWDSAFVPGYKPRLSHYFILHSYNSEREKYYSANTLPVIGLSDSTTLSDVEREKLDVNVAELLRTQAVNKYGGPAMSGDALRRMAEDEEDDKEEADKKYKSNFCRNMETQLFSPGSGRYIKGASERVYQVYHWIHTRLTKRMAEGGMDMPAPIMATAWQNLSNGLIAFEGCRWLTDTPFPFNYAQVIILVLLCFTFSVPFIIVATISSKVYGTIFALFLIHLYWSLNEVARELEDPFYIEPNDLPLTRLQYQFNQRLLAVANTKMPVNENRPRMDLRLKAELLNSSSEYSRADHDFVSLKPERDGNVNNV
jgi:predicted membrane chloride channel (bestrophin family)